MAFIGRLVAKESIMSTADNLIVFGPLLAFVCGMIFTFSVAFYDGVK
jgi:hypothetical protein